MPHTKTPNLNLNVDYDGTETVQNWSDGMDENFETLDEILGDIFDAIEEYQPEEN